MSIKHFETVLNQFLTSRKTHPEEKGRKVPGSTDQLPLGGIKVVDAAIMVFDIADSSNVLSKMREKGFTELLGMTLHLFFHCVDEYKGAVDKYTGDGAMVSFSVGSAQERCSNSLSCAVKMSEILYKILNPLYKKRRYNLINIRIGLDYGQIRIEKVGKRAISHLIIVGSPANTAKKLEEYGKKLKFDQNTTICFGYDILHNLSKSDKISSSNGQNLYKQVGSFSNGRSYMTKNQPYLFYEYFGRFR